MKNKKLNRFRIHKITAFVSTSLFCAIASFSTPVSAQETEVEPTTIEATINSNASSQEAKTIQDPTIEIDDLKLFLKPMILEELENEGAGWLFLLKNKTQEISDAEIAIKRDNRFLEAKKKAIEELNNVDIELKAAEKTLKESQPNTPEYEAAESKIKTGVESLKQGAISLDKLAEIEAELKQDQIGQANLKEAKEVKIINEAKEVLSSAQKANKDTDKNKPQSPEITDKISTLQKSIKNLDILERDLEVAIPNSAKSKQIKESIDIARQVVKKDTGELIKINPQLIDGISDISKAAFDPSYSTKSITTEDLRREIDRLNLNNFSVGEIEKQVKQIAEEFETKLEEEKDIKNQLVLNVTDLQQQQRGIIDRLNIVLESIEDKGGDITSYNKYLDTIQGVDLDLTDTEGLGVRFMSWLKSPDGGLRLVLGIAKFGTIVLLSVAIAPWLGKFADRLLGKVGNISTLFRNFIVTILKRGVIVVGTLVGLSALGINLTPILALVGGASFVLAFALQSNLGNLASGLMLLINKPFDVGDEVKVAGYWAYVKSISLASTTIEDFSGNLITLPNNTVWGGDIINYTHSDIRKLRFGIDVKFEQDLDKVYQMWMEITANHPKVLDTPKPGWFPWNSNYAYYIPVGLTAWAKTEDYWGVYVELLKELQKRIIDLDIQLTPPQQMEIQVTPSQKNLQLSGSTSDKNLVTLDKQVN